MVDIPTDERCVTSKLYVNFEHFDILLSVYWTHFYPVRKKNELSGVMQSLTWQIPVPVNAFFLTLIWNCPSVIWIGNILVIVLLWFPEEVVRSNACMLVNRLNHFLEWHFMIHQFQKWSQHSLYTAWAVEEQLLLFLFHLCVCIFP